MRPRALFSVSDKAGASDFAARLAGAGWDLIASGGTARLLREAGLKVEEVAAVTGSPEMLGGRVKTLHPAIHGALLCRPEQDAGDIARYGIRPIDLAVINLYPFVEAASRADAEPAKVVEQIDVGGPAMIRAAAKNHERVGVVVDPSDYDAVASEIEAAGALGEDTRRRLAVKAFDHTARYDRAICGWLEGAGGEAFAEAPGSAGMSRTAVPPSAEPGAAVTLPERLSLELVKQAGLRYGENPHQQAALYAPSGAPGADGTRLLGGKPLSYNNLADADLARHCALALPDHACAIVKHATPCGVAVSGSASEAYQRAFAADPESAFGGVIAFNCAVDEDAARAVSGQFAEVVIAPGFSPGAIEVLKKRGNLRIVEQAAPCVGGDSGSRRLGEVNCGDGSSGSGLPGLKVLDGAVLAQTSDSVASERHEVVSRRAPTDEELRDAGFAWTVARFVSSNAVVYARDGQTLGIGGGQTSRVMSARIAAWRAADCGFSLKGAAMASDGFLPFADGLETAADEGITVVIQPGGSIRDKEVIAAADERGVAMLFTGVRHFRH
ncbi:MAG: bifunctional phosphoribosylaminoimidazolecarboxamide formyltransferase/IMP cyclohydrolase [Gammaproteobacteria bacterium]|nr:bifunctional phosphoribosylaminoimidazolecarboxamide formyltransferase/IMP cyclohydrolase [Gammaproteobacteria bacterium]MYD01079.1 bifunctional phosphoribosylaminoimidazolecarboxamide formyltransferase/IMP cyclohydrolase [Gammaproteobacteria bacterium]MYI23913.1 bifunctional phosphoribosylaminoimidazolecarboxamide formyltransferase/IMP cyclohydrolase [Gammaproteobacteria bacterium]